jgi:hypothetical protein
VLSENDKESLDHAMSMMSPNEIVAVEEEVRKIQNNVRAWLLRKNYTNLRDAARTLQVAWRERRERCTVSPRYDINSLPNNTMSLAHSTSSSLEDSKSKIVLCTYF